MAEFPEYFGLVTSPLTNNCFLTTHSVKVLGESLLISIPEENKAPNSFERLRKPVIASVVLLD